jgi:adenylate cyclase
VEGNDVSEPNARPPERVAGDPPASGAAAPGAVEARANRRRLLARLGEALRSSDGKPRLVTAARIARELLPGDSEFGDPLSTAGSEPAHVLGRQLSALSEEKPSVLGEIGLSALQVWESMSGTKGTGEREVAILFTDLVDFSRWALQAGDTTAVELLRVVGLAIEPAVTRHNGIVVKRLGDGLMAVFDDPSDAVEAALDAHHEMERVEVGGHRPHMRAGVHFGRPKTLGGDYLGVDVNIAARVAGAASAGEVLISETARERLGDEAPLRIRRRRFFRAKGAPPDLRVYRVSRPR